MAANQLRMPSAIVGYWATHDANTNSLALNATTTWLAMQFVSDQAKTLNKVKLYLGTKTGTPLNTEMTCDIFSDAAGIPNASVDGPKSADSAPASGNWMQWSGFTTSLTAGVAYWAVFKNTNATAASNFPTYGWVGSTSQGRQPIPTGVNQIGAVSYGWNKVHTTNSGAAWATGPNPGVGGLRLEYSDATFDGVPMQAATRPQSGTTGDRAFGKQEVGARFNIPSGATWNVRGVWMPLFKTGSPGALRFRIYQGVTLLGTTIDIPAANILSSGNGDTYAAYFSSAITLVSTNNPYRVVMSDATAADANTAGYNSWLSTWENDANSLALKPMNGTLQKTITADNTASPVVFTDTSTDILPFALLLDTAGELTGASGVGASPIGLGSPVIRAAA